ncbi:MAG: hypothetical protein IPH62_19330 [Ignavibacteriae bacterium]|nr:hypothetical protein [Ignavibacteriota bacterium]
MPRRYIARKEMKRLTVLLLLILLNCTFGQEQKFISDSLFFSISNQSYEIPNVDIIIIVNGDTLFNKIMNVDDQHNYEYVSTNILTYLTEISIESIKGKARTDFRYEHYENENFVIEFYDINGVGYFGLSKFKIMPLVD